MEGSGHRGEPGEIEPWEWEILTQVLLRVGTNDVERLKTELTAKLASLKREGKRGDENPAGYLWRALYRHALNVVRSDVDVEELAFNAVEAFEEERPSVQVAGPDILFDRRMATQIAIQSLPPNQRRLWDILLENGGDRQDAERRLGVHRNTIRRWLNDIEKILKRHGIL
jgi:DNA-directed RNA polymerase specialized sigma24 family protein